MFKIFKVLRGIFQKLRSPEEEERITQQAFIKFCIFSAISCTIASWPTRTEVNAITASEAH